MAELRNKAVQFLHSISASSNKTTLQDEILQNRRFYVTNTPNSDFIHWYLYNLGCVSSFINRDVPEFDRKWDVNGHRKLLDHAKRQCYWRHFILGKKPDSGDIVLIGGSDQQEKYFIFVNRDNDKWILMDEDIRFKIFTFSGETLSADNVKSRILGWIDLNIVMDGGSNARYDT